MLTEIYSALSLLPDFFSKKAQMPPRLPEGYSDNLDRYRIRAVSKIQPALCFPLLGQLFFNAYSGLSIF